MSLLLLLIFFSSLCSLALSGSTVTHLPGFAGPLPFRLETGYIGVGEANGVQLFYYFIESEQNPAKDPVMLWLTGGPGCSSFCGLVFEIGPLKFRSVEYDGSLPTLVYNPNSWTKVASVIFLDSPVGTGFSFSTNLVEGYKVGDVSSSRQVSEFLRKWFLEHPQFLDNPLYIAGDSYAGKVVPVITQHVMEGIEAGIQPLLNFEGYLVGNPMTGENIDVDARLPFAHGMGIISDELYESVSRICGKDYLHPTSEYCVMALEPVTKLLSEINEPNILEPNCPLSAPKPEDMIGDKRSLEEANIKFLEPPSPPPLWCRTYVHFLAYFWANSNEVRHALHIQKGTVIEWKRCNHGLAYSMDIPSSIKYHFNVTSKGYRALIYSGDHDMVVPFPGTQEWIRSLNFSIVDDWRSWHVDGQVAGYMRTYSNNLTFATVKGAGHTAPEYRPKECLAMIRRWISHKPL